MRRLKEKMAKLVKKLRGFTLLEILLVVTILTIIVAMAIPTLRTSKRSAYEAGASKALRTLSEAEMAYQNLYGHYTSFEGLRQLNFIDPGWRKYNSGGDLRRMAKHYSIDYHVRNTYKWFTFGYEYIAFPDSNMPFDVYYINESGVIQVIRGGALQPR